MTISDRLALVRITAEALSVDACLAAVRHPAAGGLGCFVGVVRDHDDDRRVVSLEYEAHPSAERALRTVCEKVTAGNVIAVAAEHRVGTLGVGEIAVVVAVSATHRGQALNATRELIDAIKVSVPIWKHQRFADGSDEWVGCD